MSGSSENESIGSPAEEGVSPGVMNYERLITKLKNEVEAERHSAVTLLTRIFSEEGSTLATEVPALWFTYLGRFNDISKDIRLTCINSVQAFFMNHEHLRKDLIEVLKVRFNDAEELIRFELVKEFVAIGLTDFSIVTQDKELLELLGQRTKDRKFSVRKEAIQGLGRIYEKLVKVLEEIPEEMRSSIQWLKNILLLGFLTKTVPDQLTVERVLVSRMVNYKSAPEERMMKLLYLYLGLEERGASAFEQIQNAHLLLRVHFVTLLRFIESNTWTATGSEQLDRQLVIQITKISAYFPEPNKAQFQLVRLGKSLKTDKRLCNLLGTVLRSDSDCELQLEATNQLLKKMGQPGPKNLYYQAMKLLMERSTSVLIDKHAVRELLKIIRRLAVGEESLMQRLDVVDKETGLRRALQLLRVLGPIYPVHLHPAGLGIAHLLQIIPDTLHTSLLSTLRSIGRRMKLTPECLEILLPYCEKYILRGRGRDVKIAIRCAATSLGPGSGVQFFEGFIPILQSYLTPGHAQYESGIIALGHISQYYPAPFKDEMRRIMKKLVKNLLLRPERTERDSLKNVGEWCEREELPEKTQQMIQGMKALVRWLIGLKTDTEWPEKVNDLLMQFVLDEVKPTYPFSSAEKSWLRLAAATSFLELCTFRGVGDAYTAMQLCRLAPLMADPVREIRVKFSLKLYRGLSHSRESGVGGAHWYPVEFLSMFALAGYEKDRKQKQELKFYMRDVMKLRLDYSQLLRMRGDAVSLAALPLFMPEYIVVFAIPYLSAFNPHFTSHTDLAQLNQVKACLWTILEPLLKLDSYSFSFFRALIERLKSTTNALVPEDKNIDLRMYAVCDLIMGILLHKSPTIDNVPQNPVSTDIAPRGYLVRMNQLNHRSYLPQNMNFNPSPKPKVGYKWKYKDSDDEDLDLDVTKPLEPAAPTSAPPNSDEDSDVNTPSPAKKKKQGVKERAAGKRAAPTDGRRGQKPDTDTDWEAESPTPAKKKKEGVKKRAGKSDAGPTGRDENGRGGGKTGLKKVTKSVPKNPKAG